MTSPEAFLVLGLPDCRACGNPIEEDAVDSGDGGYCHPECGPVAA